MVHWNAEDSGREVRGYVKKPPLTWIDANTVGLVGTDTVPIWLTIGEHTGRLSGTLRANIGASGLGGMASGTVAASTAYYVYAVLSGGMPYLIIDATPPTQGPSGYGTWTYLGAVATQEAAAEIYPFCVQAGYCRSDQNIEGESHTGDTTATPYVFAAMPVTATKASFRLRYDGTNTGAEYGRIAGTLAGNAGTTGFLGVSGSDLFANLDCPIVTPQTVYLYTHHAGNTVYAYLNGWQEDPELYL